MLALLDAGDRHHDRAVGLVEATREDIVVPGPILGEVDYFLRKLDLHEGWRAFFEDIEAGAYRLHQPDEGELARAVELELRYSDLDLGLVDASVVVTCETLREDKVATLDHRHFVVVRPAHCDALTLLPM